MLNKSFLFFFILITTISVLYSQWTSNTGINTVVCDTTGEQALVKVAICPDGSSYLSWFDNRSSGYAVYIQKLDINGNRLFPTGGLLVSNNPQNSSLVDYDLIADAQGNAIVTFTDIRNSGQINPFAYKISPSGTMLWGSNGVTLTDSINSFQPNPHVVETSDGNYIFIWRIGSGPTKIYMQKLNSSGVKQWGSSPILITSGTNENYDWPALVSSDNGSMIMMWAGYTGTFLNPVGYKLYTQKFSSSGARVWNSTQDTVYSLGRVSGFYQPRIFSDGNNGAIFCWRDDRNSQNLQTGYIQRINSAGGFQFPVNGSPVSTLAGYNHFDPVASYMSATGEIISFWYESNSLQSSFGVYGQKFSSSGVQLWGSNGIAFQPLNSNQPSNFSTYVKDTNAICYYNELASGNNNIIKAFRVGKSGAFVWPGNILTASSYSSSKIRLNAGLYNNNGMSILAWEDMRSGGGIYAQNINFEGSFGIPVGIHQLSSNTPEKFSLSQNYPNPFNPSTKIKFDIPVNLNSNSVFVKLLIYDILGREVATLVKNELQPGSYEITWDASKFGSAVYFYRLSAGSYSETRKMIINK